MTLGPAGRARSAHTWIARGEPFSLQSGGSAGLRVLAPTSTRQRSPDPGRRHYVRSVRIRVPESGFVFAVGPDQARDRGVNAKGGRLSRPISSPPLWPRGERGLE